MHCTFTERLYIYKEKMKQNDVSTQITYIVDGIMRLEIHAQVLWIIDISFIFINRQNHNTSCIFSISFLGCLASTSLIHNQEQFCTRKYTKIRSIIMPLITNKVYSYNPFLGFTASTDFYHFCFLFFSPSWKDTNTLDQ